MTLTVAEPFSGAGGMTLGLAGAGFHHVYAADADEAAVATLRQVVPHALVESLTKGNATAVGKRIGRVDLVAAGVPCQPFSTAGPKKGQADPRDGFPAFLKLVKIIRPRAVLVENVKGLVMRRNAQYLRYLVGSLQSLGYLVQYVVINAADHGIPQRRERLFLLGLEPEAGYRFQWPPPSHSESSLVWSKWGTPGQERGGVVGASYWAEHPEAAGPDVLPSRRDQSVLRWIREGRLTVGGLRWRTIRDAIGDLLGARANPSIANHDLEDTAKTVRGLGGQGPELISCRTAPSPPVPAARGKFGKRHPAMDLDGASATIVAKQDSGVVNLVDWHGLRRLTVRENARLQGFPDEIVFHGSKTAQYRQVGNACPPLLAAVVGLAIRQALEGA